MRRRNSFWARLFVLLVVWVVLTFSTDCGWCSSLIVAIIVIAFI